MKIAENGIDVYSISALRDFFGVDYKNGGINEKIIFIAKHLYKVESTKKLIESRKRNEGQARMLCFYLLHEFSNPVMGRLKIADTYRTQQSAVHERIDTLKSYIKTPQFNKDLLKNYAELRAEVEKYVQWINGEPKETSGEKTDVAEKLLELERNIELENKTQNKMKNKVDDASELHLAVPGVNESPTDEPVIDRNNGKAVSEIINSTSAVQDAVIEDQEKAKENIKPPIKPSFSQEEIEEDQYSRDEAEEESEEDVPAYQFDTPPNQQSSQGGYAIPPEAKEWATNFSSKSIIDMVNLILPKTVSEFVQIDEQKITKVLSDADRPVKEKAIKEVRSLNREHEQELVKKVKEITPFMETPLKEALAIHDLTLSPVAVVLILCAWMGITMFLTSRKMSQRCDTLVSDLEAMMERKRAFDHPNTGQMADQKTMTVA